MDAQTSRYKEHAKELLRSQRTFRQALVALRQEQRLSQNDVATRLGTTQSAVAQFEAYDANPTLNAIRRYALAVDADIEFIVRPRNAVVSRPIQAHEGVIERKIDTTVDGVDWRASTFARRSRRLEHA